MPFTTPASVLTVMAHPDDAELWAGGTLARCSASGAAVTIAVPRHAEPGRDTEAAAGATILGATLYQYDQLTMATLRELLLAVRPEVVITHPLRDVHPDHRAVADTLVAALPEVVIATGHPHRVYIADSYNSLTLDGPIPAHTIIDITDTYEQKQRALAAHASQPITDHFGPMAETLARLWGSRIGVNHAENFVPLPVLGRLPVAPAM
ncbi:PIG-L family deacetylase [Amycolatopsis roodepoortensis]|uniref:PIG-L deacetylase family protein n=1 Tax=Amycolatopsis roodepoortensis TaxID=700274 RepID=UPI00214C8705|nr:PIG-L family deacetylase [Amycolatopsis roodepoortensis]UUV28537.1 PIG-L family deacetylase [Amycolatopsis roodepoortensis]